MLGQDLMCTTSKNMGKEILFQDDFYHFLVLEESTAHCSIVLPCNV